MYPKGNASEDDLDDLMKEALTDEDTGQAPSAPLRRRAEFIRGPFDRAQFCLVASLGHAPLVIWVLVHHLIRLKHRSDILLPNRLLAACRIKRHAKVHALAKLERMGLILVTRRRGQAPRISLVELPEDDGA